MGKYMSPGPECATLPETVFTYIIAHASQHPCEVPKGQIDLSHFILEESGAESFQMTSRSLREFTFLRLSAKLIVKYRFSDIV